MFNPFKRKVQQESPNVLGSSYEQPHLDIEHEVIAVEKTDKICKSRLSIIAHNISKAKCYVESLGIRCQVIDENNYYMLPSYGFRWNSNDRIIYPGCTQIYCTDFDFNVNDSVIKITTTASRGYEPCVKWQEISFWEFTNGALKRRNRVSREVDIQVFHSRERR